MSPYAAEEDADAPPPPRARRAARLETQALLRQADALYASFSCPATAECCQLATTKRQPWLWLGEWLVLEDRLRRERRTVTPRADGACPLLTEAGRCSVYEDRPFGCRTFFCHRIQGPARQPTEAVNALLERFARASQAADPETEPRPLLEWLSRYTAAP